MLQMHSYILPKPWRRGRLLQYKLSEKAIRALPSYITQALPDTWDAGPEKPAERCSVERGGGAGRANVAPQAEESAPTEEGSEQSEREGSVVSMVSQVCPQPQSKMALLKYLP